MACGATLKRAHEFDFDPLLSPSRSPKRMCVSKELMSPCNARKTCSPTNLHSAAFIEAAQKYANGNYSPSASPSTSGSCGAAALGLWRTCHQDQSATLMSLSHTNVSAAVSRCVVTPSHSDTTLSRSNEPLFSLSQVDNIVRHVVSEREEVVREKFNAVLHNKLAEQHEAFVKFNSDQLSRRFTSQQTDCAYVS